jgi:ABC-type multidrug transport system ATPase subunit
MKTTLLGEPVCLAFGIQLGQTMPILTIGKQRRRSSFGHRGISLRAYGEKTGQAIVLLLIAGSGVVAIARGMSLTFLAIRLQQDFGLSPAMIGVLIGAGPLLGAAVSPFAGTISDRIGRRVVLVTALLFAGLGLVGLGLAQSVAAFALAHIVSSISAAVYEPVSRALMSDAAPEKLRLKMFSWRYLMINAGWAVGPMIGLAIGANSPLPFVIAGIVHFVFAAAIFAIIPAALANSAGSTVAAQAPGFRRLSAALRDRRLLFYVGGGILLMAVYGQWSVTLSQYLTTNLADGMKIFAWLVTTNAAVVVLATAPARMVIEKIGPMRAMVLGCVLFLGGELGFAISTDATMLIGFMVLFTIGEVLVVPAEYVRPRRPQRHRQDHAVPHHHRRSSPEGGSISLPKERRIGGVAQEAPGGPETLIEVVLAADTERAALIEESETATDPHRIAEIETRLADINAHSAPARAATVLHGLGFDEEAQQRPALDFSGGWRMRVALAAVLFSEPDLLLLDEPTNYLDLEGTLWLYDYLERYPHTVLVVSHDRDLLDTCVDHILHLDQGKLTIYRGGYTSFARQRAESRCSSPRPREAGRRAQASPGLRRPLQGQGLEGAPGAVARQAAGEDGIDRDHRRSRRAALQPARAGAAALAADDRAEQRQRRLWRPHRAVEAQPDALLPDDRIALLGSNGNGKSTFCKLIGGRLPPLTGEMRRSSKLETAYFAQHQLDELRMDDTPVTRICAT